MQRLEHHRMTLESVSSIGTEQWCCSECERVELHLRWHADSRQIIVNPGDESIVHHHSDENVPYTVSDDGPSLTSAEQERLRPWLLWFNEIEVDDWWGPDD
ncbi:MAG: hypothetical protein U0559_18460 [Anaerolineae bacterium]